MKFFGVRDQLNQQTLVQNICAFSPSSKEIQNSLTGPGLPARSKIQRRYSLRVP
jgi:hypothetical protein